MKTSNYLYQVVEYWGKEQHTQSFSLSYARYSQNLITAKAFPGLAQRHPCLSCQPFFPAHQGASEGQHNSLVYWLLPPVCWGSTVSQLCRSVMKMINDIGLTIHTWATPVYHTPLNTVSCTSHCCSQPLESDSSASFESISLSSYLAHISSICLWGCEGRQCQK